MSLPALLRKSVVQRRGCPYLTQEIMRDKVACIERLIPEQAIETQGTRALAKMVDTLQDLGISLDP
jgi:hypothetical protein